MYGSRKNEVQLTDPVPARCAELLAAGEVDFALVPVIEYQRIKDLSVVPDVCVGSRQRVRSVVLASKEDDLRAVRRVALDESSRTSAALVKIIFREFLGLDPEWHPVQPDLQKMLSENDAALIIGDPGMTFSRHGLRVFDLATLWREYTGLGFVFAMWMGHANGIDSPWSVDFAAVRDEGLARKDEIVSQYLSKIPLSREELLVYLTENITFNVDQNMEQGLKLYFDLAERHGLIEKAHALNYMPPLRERAQT